MIRDIIIGLFIIWLLSRSFGAKAISSSVQNTGDGYTITVTYDNDSVKVTKVKRERGFTIDSTL